MLPRAEGLRRGGRSGMGMKSAGDERWCGGVYVLSGRCESRRSVLASGDLQPLVRAWSHGLPDSAAGLRRAHSTRRRRRSRAAAARSLCLPVINSLVMVR